MKIRNYDRILNKVFEQMKKWNTEIEIALKKHIN